MSQIYKQAAGGGGGNVQFLQGDAGGQIGPDGFNTIYLLGGAGIDVTGVPATNTLTITATGNTIVNQYLADAIWTMNAGTQVVEVLVLGAGGGGGSGRQGVTAQSGGGGGGGSGGASYSRIPATLITSPANITVGLGGPGGASQVLNNTDGNAGTVGGNSSFGTLIFGNGGGGGGAGRNGAAAGGVEGEGLYSTAGGGVGQLGNGTAGNGAILSISNTFFGPGTGAGGGGGANSVTVRSGGVGGAHRIGGTNIDVGGTSGIETGVINGGNGNAALNNSYWAGGTGGGGGGGQSVGLVAGNGGNGGNYGSGGGGGGGSLNGTNSGAGGNGSNGIVYVIEYL